MVNNKSIQQLILAIKKEYELYEDILKLSNTKRDLIVQGDIEKISEITGKEQALILSIGKFEDIRASIVLNIEKEFNFKQSKDLTDLAKQIGSEAETIIGELRDKFAELINEVNNANDLNGKLIQQSLEYIEFNMNLINTVDDNNTTYNNKADDSAYHKEASLFDLKV